jgi:GT2 family glycosyltransferase
VDWVAGTACFYRKEVLDKIGLLDERYVMYHEDLELCLRIKRNTEYKVCMFSDKLVTHCLEGRRRAPLDTGKVLRLRYYGHRNYMLLLTTYSPSSVKKALLYSLLDMMRDMVIQTWVGILACVRTRHLGYLTIGIQASVQTAKGTLHGLRMKQSG